MIPKSAAIIYFGFRNNDDISFGLNLNHYLQRFCSDYNKIDTIEINGEDHTDSFLKWYKISQ